VLKGTVKWLRRMDHEHSTILNNDCCTMMEAKKLTPQRHPRKTCWNSGVKEDMKVLHCAEQSTGLEQMEIKNEKNEVRVTQPDMEYCR